MELLTDETLTLLGAPIKEAAVGKVLKEKLEDLERMGERLKEIDAHDALFLLRNSFAIPKLMYFLRTSPVFKNQEIMSLYDNKLREILQSILNVQLEEDALVQSSLPVAMGGLGVHMASDLALPAFLASAHGTGPSMATLLPEDKRDLEYELQIEAETSWKAAISNNNDEDIQLPLAKAVQAQWGTSR